MRRGDPNVVLIANPGADLYGSDRMALGSVQALVRAGRRVFVTVPNNGPLVPLLEQSGAHVLLCETPIVRKGLLNARGILTLLWLALTSFRRMCSVIHRTHAGVVIANTVTAPMWPVVSRLCGRFTLSHVHEAEATVAAPVRAALYLPLLFCHRIIINSAFAMGVLAQSAPWLRRRTTVVHNVVVGPAKPVPPRMSLQPPLRLLYVGRLSERKGPQVAVAALADLVGGGCNVTLALLGDVFPGNDEYARRLRGLVGEQGLRDRVKFLGFKSEIWPHMADSDIVLVPSLVDESFGNTAVEAALAGRPAVVSRVGGLPEAVAHTSSAFLTEPGDAAGIADAVRVIAAHWEEYSGRACHDAVGVAEIFSEESYSVRICTLATRPPRR